MDTSCEIRMIGVFERTSQQLSYQERVLWHSLQKPCIKTMPRPKTFIEAFEICEADVDLILLSEDDVAWKNVFGSVLYKEKKKLDNTHHPHFIFVDYLTDDIVSFREALSVSGGKFVWSESILLRALPCQ